MNNQVWRLLRRNISGGQLAGYALANLVGLSIVLTAVQFYRDVATVWDADDSFISRDYMILSKHVTANLLGGGMDANSFTAAEIDGIAAQPWARRVGEFTSAAFNVSASISMGGRGMSTALFLESIPDEYFDISPTGWREYAPGDSTSVVPIVISKDYLALYNFGFASSRGLPQLSESLVGSVPLRLSLSGNGRQQYVPARIVGFSSRLNTIAVPGAFMEWANARFGEGDGPEAPSRLIVEVSSPGDPAIAQYLDANGYEAAGDKADNGRASRFLAVVTAAVIGVGAIISLLSFFILLLSIYLLLQKNREKIRDLILLGYTPQAVASHYYIMVAAVNAVVLVLAGAVVVTASRLWMGPLGELGVGGASLTLTLVLDICIVVFITSLNIAAISHNVRRVV